MILSYWLSVHKRNKVQCIAQDCPLFKLQFHSGCLESILHHYQFDLCLFLMKVVELKWVSHLLNFGLFYKKYCLTIWKRQSIGKKSHQGRKFLLLCYQPCPLTLTEGKNESGFQGNSVIDGFMNLQWLLPS